MRRTAVMSNFQRKQKLYEVGCEAIRKLTGESDIGYVCPICLNNFPQIQDLTEEHVPPDSVGGKVLCLTCRKCNSELGHQIDSHVHREQLSHSFMAKDGKTRRATLIKDGQSLNVEVRNDAHGPTIQILRQNEPQLIDKLQLKVLLSGSDLTLRDRISYSRSKANVGYLKSAYLAAFAKLGYTYILRPELDRVRQQIRSPHVQLLKLFRLEASGADDVEKALLLFQNPVRCVGVKIGKTIVCLPVDGIDLYEKLQQMRSAGWEDTWQVSEKSEWPERFELMLDFSGRYRLEKRNSSPSDVKE
jgi:hypothetical protein